MAVPISNRFHQAISAFQHSEFRKFYSGLLASSLGSQIRSTANMWLVYELTGSPLHLGLTGLARGLPILVFSLMGGVIADRVDRGSGDTGYAA